MVGVFFVLAGCSSPTDPPAAHTGTPVDSSDSGGDTAILLDHGWTIDDPVPCDAPVEPAWAESAAFAPLPAATGDGLPPAEPGGIALVPRPTGPALFFAEANGPASGIDLATGEIVASDLATSASGFSQGDLDGDGLEDLVVNGFDPVVVWAAGTSAQVVDALPHRVSGQNFLRDSALGDFDEDGDLDLFQIYTGPGQVSDEQRGQVLVNDGARGFTEEALPAITDAEWGAGFDVLTMDFDGDGHLDVYVCNDTPLNIGGNHLFFGDGAGGFASGDAGGADVSLDCMGVTVGDVDGDDDIDLVIGDSLRAVLIAQDSGIWYDASTAVGLNFWVGIQMAFGVQTPDLDNDGSAEIVVPTSEFWNENATPEFAVYDFERPAGGGVYVDTGRLPQQAGARTVVTQDLDGDGTLDVLLGDSFRTPWRLMGSGCTAGNWLEIDAPTGTIAHVTAGGTTRAAYVSTDSSYGSSGPSIAHVGLGTATSVERVELDVPTAGRVVLDQVLAGRQRIRWRP